MRAEDCGLVFIADPNWAILKYFTDWEVLSEYVKAKKRGDPPKKVGEFIRVTLTDGTTKDVHDFANKGQFIPAIDHIYRLPKKDRGNVAQILQFPDKCGR